MQQYSQIDNSSAHYSATFPAIKEQEETVKIDFTSDNTEVYNKPFWFQAINHVGKAPRTWNCWDPQQSAETSLRWHSEDPKRDPKQDMDLCGFFSIMKSSSSDPNPKNQ